MFKKILLIAAVAVLILVVFDLCVTLIYAQKIQHRYASAEEGRELLLANTEYYENFTQNDIDFRLQRSDATLEELLDASAAEISDFNFIEKYIIDRRIARMALTLETNGYELPPIEEIVFVKSGMSVEMGANGYTHGTEVYLNSTNILVSLIPGAGGYFDKLLWHELFHCLTRCNPEFRAKMYGLIHFTVEYSDYALPPCVQDYCISNPDVEHHDSYATFIIDGTDTYYVPEQAANFNEVFGTNTGYVIDPEECMADNFAFAMLYGLKGKYGQGYPNPEIIQGIIDIMKR